MSLPLVFKLTVPAVSTIPAPVIIPEVVPVPDVKSIVPEPVAVPTLTLPAIFILANVAVKLNVPEDPTLILAEFDPKPPKLIVNDVEPSESLIYALPVVEPLFNVEASKVAVSTFIP